MTPLDHDRMVTVHVAGRGGGKTHEAMKWVVENDGILIVQSQIRKDWILREFSHGFPTLEPDQIAVMAKLAPRVSLTRLYGPDQRFAIDNLEDWLWPSVEYVTVQGELT